METGAKQEAECPVRPWGQAAGTAVDRHELAVHLSELARALQKEDDPAATLARTVKAAVALIPGADEGSISVVTNRLHIGSQAPSSELPRQVDALQAETGQGPCLDAVFEHQTVRVPDMATETRWPHFARRAYEAGAASMLSFQLYVDGDNLGALNLYARTAGAFDEESEHVGLLFAAHAAVAYSAANQQENMRGALTSRDLIGQAKGILMERFKITGDQAFSLLTHASQARNVKLRDVADQLVHSGEFTETP